MLRKNTLSLIVLALTTLTHNAHADQLDSAAQQQRLEKIQSEMKSVSHNWHTKGPLMMGSSENVRSSSPPM